MIKLNNKNITYVALADTNNSLKAPKEIWYADSSNSVKLVYRRKDALIEGMDYEKYHWLKGDGTAFIRTDKSINIGDEVDCSIIPINDIPAELNWRFVYGNDGGDNPYTFMCVIFSSNSMRFRHKRAFTSYISNKIYSIKHSISNVFVNGTELTYESEANYTESSRTLMLFNSSNSTTNYVFSGYIGNFRLTNKLSLIPCKLLKPVPKWLDANGIRRQVGECGMIDLVSGKFYGNVNSVGTFTVENYYERKEWLVGDGSAYINTNIKLIIGDFIEVKFDCSMCPLEDRLFGRERNGSSDEGFESRFLFRCRSNNYSTFWGKEVYTVELSEHVNSVLIDLTQNIMQFKSGESAGITCGRDGDYSLFLFADNNRGNVRYASLAKISHFEIDRQISLIPCTLTMDLPASMDANNIARTKGTSGMWDLVSDRFYGNVANSGTFKAVNLAEGVDYEVHQWLKTGGGNPYIQVAGGCNTDNDAYLETTFKGASVNGDKDIIIGFGSDNSFGYRLFVGGQAVFIDIHKRTSGVLNSKRLNFSYPPYQICHIFVDSNRYEFNNVAGTYELGNGFDTGIMQHFTRIFTNQSNNDMHYAETKMRVNNVEYDLIPVKLLKSIPSTYDANGIARNAGECGMYDTVNDVFYGNVASSGTFTVSDDN